MSLELGGWGKFYERAFEGSMRGAGSDVYALMGYCISHSKPPDGELEIEEGLVAFKIGMTVEALKKALEYLTSSDPRSRTPSEDGRRLIQIGPFLYRLVNWGIYRNQTDIAARQQYFRERKRIQRAEAASKKTKSSTWNHDETHPTVKFSKPTIEEVKLAAAKIGLSEHEASKFFAHYESNGWRVGKNPMKSLNGSLAGWKLRNEENYGKGSQQTGRGSGRRSFDRNAGTFNAGTTEQYDTAKIQAARELRSQQPGTPETPG